MRVGRAGGRLQHHRGVLQRRLGEQLARPRPAGLGHLGGALAGRFGKAPAVGRHRGRGRRARQHEAQRLGHAGHGRGGAHHHAGAGRRHELVVRAVEVRRRRASRRDTAAHSRRQSVQAPSRVPSCLPASIEPTLTTIAGMSARDRAHQLGRNGLVAAADQHHGVERQRLDHLLDVHRHQVAQQHRGRERERLVQRHGREHERQRAGHPHAARDRFGDLRRGLVAGVEVGGGGEDADDRPVERLVGEARALEKAAPQEQRELLVAVLGEAGPKAFFHGNSPSDKRTWRCRHCSIARREGVNEKRVARPVGDETGRADRTARGKGGFSRRSLGCGGDGDNRRMAIGRGGPGKGSTAILPAHTGLVLSGLQVGFAGRRMTGATIDANSY